MHLLKYYLNKIKTNGASYYDDSDSDDDDDR